MSQFQTILGIVLIIVAVIIIALAIYNLIIITRATTNTNDTKSTITDGEKKGAIASNIILIVIALVLGVYGVVVVMPEHKHTRALSDLRESRSVAGSVLSASGQYM